MGGIMRQEASIVSDNAKRIARIVEQIETQGIKKGDFVLIRLKKGEGEPALGVVHSGSSNFLTGPYISIQSGSDNSRFLSTIPDYWYKRMDSIEKISPGDRIEVKLKGGRTLAGKFDGYEFTNPYDTKIYVRDDKGRRTAALYSGRSENEIVSITKTMETMAGKKKV